MKVYTRIGYYNDPEDIIDLYPSSTFKGDEADIIVKYYLDGYGAFNTIDCPYPYITPEEASKYPNVVFTSDGEYIVAFSRGDRSLLLSGSNMHGFFIYIYRLADVEDKIDAEQKTVDVRKLQETYDRLVAIREKIDKVLMDIAPYVAQ